MFLKTVDLDIKIEYLFVVDIDFNLEQSNAKTLKWNTMKYIPLSKRY